MFNLKSRIKDYLDNSSIHGLQYISENDRHWTERLFWLVAVCTAMYFSYDVMEYQYYDFEEHPVSFVVETDYLHWNTHFPAVSVCQKKFIGYPKMENYIKSYVEDLKINGENINKWKITKIKSYMTDMMFYGKCVECKNCKNFPCFTNYMEVSEKVKDSCPELFDYCLWSGQRFNCCDSFHPLLNEYGLCYTVSSTHTDDSDTYKPSSAIKMISNQTTGPGILEFYTTKPSTVFIHSPEDVPFLNHREDEMWDIDSGYMVDVIFQVKEIENDPAIRTLSIDKRGCRFPSENPPHMKLYKYYSYSTCVMQCRADNQMKLCNCTQQYLAKAYPNDICDGAGQLCLYKPPTALYLRSLKAVLDDQEEEYVCGCKAGCSELEFNIVNTKTYRRQGTSQCGFRLAMQSLPAERFKRILVRSTLDLVVSMGGVAGLFLGASLLSVVEILYYIICSFKCFKNDTTQDSKTPVNNRKSPNCIIKNEPSGVCHTGQLNKIYTISSYSRQVNSYNKNKI